MTFLKGKFGFLDDLADIPFYNDVPKLSAIEWILLLASVLLIIGYISVIRIPGDYLPIACFLTSVIPALYICKGNYGLFFKRLRRKDIGLIVLCALGIVIYTLLVGEALQTILGHLAKHVDTYATPTLMDVLGTVIQLMGEEFFKIFLLLLAMHALYKITGDKKISLVIGLIFAMVIFGLSHYYSYEGMIWQIIFIQGFGSIFEYYAYLKTKNVWVSYLIHLICDMFPVVILLGQTFA